MLDISIIRHMDEARGAPPYKTNKKHLEVLHEKNKKQIL